MARQVPLTLLLLLVSLFFRFSTSSSASCPAPCECLPGHRVLCTNRGLGAVPPGSPDVVRVLVLAGNFINNVTASAFSCYIGMKSLDLQFNAIEFLHRDAFRELHGLEELYLGNNRISSLMPGTLWTLNRLTVLYANDNAIEELLPNSLGHLSNLVKLRLDKNRIERLDESALRHLPNLAFLHLESNRLRHIRHGAFASLPKLQFLNLSDNEQTELRDKSRFSKTRSLVTLLLAGNRIKYVDNYVFANLRKLTTLSLSNNRINRFGPEALKGLARLKELALDGNELTEIQAGLLDPLERLEHLDLGDNRIRNVHPAAFGHLARLKVLNLRNNHLASLSGAVFASNAGLFELDLSGNEWTCDCRAEELRSWMMEVKSQGKLLSMSVQCRHPPKLEGKYLEYVNNTQLWTPGNRTGYCESKLGGGPMESRGTRVAESLVIKEDRPKRGGEGGGYAEVKTPKDGKSIPTSRKRKKGVSPRSRSGDPGNREKSGSSSGLVGTSTNASTPLMMDDGDTTLQDPKVREGLDMPQKDKVEHYEARTAELEDACQFNRHYILNVSMINIGYDEAMVRWRTVAPAGEIVPVEGKELLFRIMYDRFGHSVQFPRYVYTEGTARAVSLQELRPDSTYIACVESVVGGALCQVAPRDHCVGFVTSPASVLAGELDLKRVTAAVLLANTLLLLLVGGVWLGRSLRRRIRSRKSSAHAHVRHMYSTRRPFRAAMATATAATCVSSEFSGYQSGRTLAEEGDLIQFPGERFFNDVSGRRNDDLMMPRFSD